MLIGILIILLGFLCASVVIRFLPEHPARFKAAAAAVVASVLTAAGAYWLVSLMPPRWPAAVFVVMISVVVVPAFVSIGIRRITYARFGLTVYGLLPVPALDVTVSQKGILWFRPKNHLAELPEIQRLLPDGVEVLVIGTGWYEGMHVDETISELEDVDVRIQPTPEAFRVFNRLQSEGKRVVLFAHSTC